MDSRSMKQVRTIREMLHMPVLFGRAAQVVWLYSSGKFLSYCIRRRPVLNKQLIGLPGKDRIYPVVLYTGARPGIRPVFIIVAGTSAFSRKRHSLNRFARALALVGYHVIIVKDENGQRIPGVTDPIEIGEIVEAVYRDERFDSSRIVLAGADFGSACLLAAMNSATTLGKVHSFLFLAPVTEISHLIDFALRGRVKIRNRWFYQPSSVKIRLLYLLYVLKNGLPHDQFEQVSGIISLLLSERPTTALEKVQRLESAIHHLLMAVYRGEMGADAIRRLRQMYRHDLDELYSKAIPATDVKRPVFIIHSILDEDIDCGQSRLLWEKLSSSAGVYLHFTDFVRGDGCRSFAVNPAGWVRGAFGMSRALYRVLAYLYSNKNFPHNPTQSALHIRD